MVQSFTESICVKEHHSWMAIPRYSDDPSSNNHSLKLLMSSSATLSWVLIPENWDMSIGGSWPCVPTGHLSSRPTEAYFHLRVQVVEVYAVCLVLVNSQNRFIDAL